MIDTLMILWRRLTQRTPKPTVFAWQESIYCPACHVRLPSLAFIRYCPACRVDLNPPCAPRAVAHPTPYEQERHTEGIPPVKPLLLSARQVSLFHQDTARMPVVAKATRVIVEQAMRRQETEHPRAIRWKK